jgi:hypothetical protein
MFLGKGKEFAEERITSFFSPIMQFFYKTATQFLKQCIDLHRFLTD